MFTLARFFSLSHLSTSFFSSLISFSLSATLPFPFPWALDFYPRYECELSGRHLGPNWKGLGVLSLVDNIPTAAREQSDEEQGRRHIISAWLPKSSEIKKKKKKKGSHKGVRETKGGRENHTPGTDILCVDDEKGGRRSSTIRY